MPIYEYQCKACGEIFDVLVLNPEDLEEARCESCGGRELARRVSGPGLVRSRSDARSGALRPIEPRDAVRGMSEMYEKSGIDPGKGFSDVARRVEAGDRPEELKEAIREARKNEAASPSASSEE